MGGSLAYMYAGLHPKTSNAMSSGLFWVILAGHIPFVGLPLVWGVRRFSRGVKVQRAEAH